MKHGSCPHYIDGRNVWMDVGCRQQEPVSCHDPRHTVGHVYEQTKSGLCARKGPERTINNVGQHQRLGNESLRPVRVRCCCCFIHKNKQGRSAALHRCTFYT